MPVIEINEKLTGIIRGRSIELVTQEEGLVTIVFDDYSTLRVKVAGGPTIGLLDEGKIESVAEGGAELTLVGENGSVATLRLAELLRDKNLRDELRDLLKVLDARERTIIFQRFGLDGGKPKTLEEVGKKFGVTRERIRQLRNIAVAKLRAALSKKEAPTPKPVTASTTTEN